GRGCCCRRGGAVGAEVRRRGALITLALMIALGGAGAIAAADKKDPSEAAFQKGRLGDRLYRLYVPRARRAERRAEGGRRPGAPDRRVARLLADTRGFCARHPSQRGGGTAKPRRPLSRSGTTGQRQSLLELVRAGGHGGERDESAHHADPARDQRATRPGSSDRPGFLGRWLHGRQPRLLRPGPGGPRPPGRRWPPPPV